MSPPAGRARETGPERSNGRLRMQSAPPAAGAAAVKTVEDAQSIIVKAAETRDVDPDTVIEAIR